VSVGYHETELIFARDVLRADDIVIDVGANIGVYTVVSALKGARVLAFEPSADARVLLQANIELNKIRDHVDVSSYALGDFSGPAGFTTDLEEGNHIAPTAEPGTASVEVRELDDLPLPTGAITLIKVDAEGYDEPVLRGARRTIEEHRPVLIVETWAGGGSVRRFLASLGYRFFVYKSSLQSVNDDFAEDTNLVAIHTQKVEWVAERLMNATPYRHRATRVRWLRKPEWVHGF
jgi:FkbM family methyltransferase